MLPDLERLIRLQQLDNAAADARRAIAALPTRLQMLDDRLQARTEAAADVQQRLTGHRGRRQEIERDLAAVQSRLNRYKDQLMEVKTNKEYQAMQKEIATAQEEVRRLEDLLLERLLEADELGVALKQAEQAAAAERDAVAHERAALIAERDALERQVEQVQVERGRLLAEISPATVALFETVARQRRGIAVVEARNGHCSFCHVRLRPQVFNDIRTNNALIQCDSCQGILYFNPESSPAVSS